MTRHGYGIVRIPQTGMFGFGFATLGFRRAGLATGSPVSGSMDSPVCAAISPSRTPDTSTSLSLGRSAFNASSVFFNAMADNDEPTMVRYLLVAADTLSAPSVSVKSASSAAVRNDSSSDRSSSTPGWLSYASAVAASRSARVRKLPERATRPASFVSERPYLAATAESASPERGHLSWLGSPSVSAAKTATFPVKRPHSASTLGRSASRKNHAAPSRSNKMTISKTRHPSQPRRCFSGAASVGSGSAGGRGKSPPEAAASSPRPASAASCSSAVGALSVCGQTSSPQAASEGPTAKAVDPADFTWNGSIASPSSVTPAAVASSLNGASGIVTSANMMSQSSLLPSVTATPSTSAISAPLFGPSTIFRRKFTA